LGIEDHFEMWALHRGGMPATDVLRAATMSGAEKLGIEEDVGSFAQVCGSGRGGLRQQHIGCRSPGFAHRNTSFSLDKSEGIGMSIRMMMVAIVLAFSPLASCIWQ
jgi:hypothetical protein